MINQICENQLSKYHLYFQKKKLVRDKKKKFLQTKQVQNNKKILKLPLKIKNYKTLNHYHVKASRVELNTHTNPF